MQERQLNNKARARRNCTTEDCTTMDIHRASSGSPPHLASLCTSPRALAKRLVADQFLMSKHSRACSAEYLWVLGLSMPRNEPLLAETHTHCRCDPAKWAGCRWPVAFLGLHLLGPLTLMLPRDAVIVEAIAPSIHVPLLPTYLRVLMSLNSMLSGKRLPQPCV